MNPERLLQHFERISEALDAIPRLRRFILDLAVRGKLVEQDPNDEPASELLKRIQVEKTRLVKEAKIRKTQLLPEFVEVEAPFDSPLGWQWMKFGDIVNFSAGRTPSRNDLSYWNTGDYPWVSIADMTDGGVVVNTKETVSEKARDKVFGSAPLDAGTMIMSFKLTIGKISWLGVPAFHNEAIISIRPYVSDIDCYLFKILPIFSQHGDKKDAIKGATLNRESISNIPIPLPPLAEQHRIVAKVDELMALCDQLEAAKTEREQSRDRLVAASLHRLNSSADTAETDASDLPARQADAFRDHARFVFKHLPRLATRPEHIKQLRQTILNLAVRGKLVPQDPNDESAERLLEKITSERNTHKNFDSTTKSNEDAFRMASKSLRLPDDWALAPLANVALTIVDCPHSTPKWEPAGILCVRTNQFRPGFLDLSDSRFVSEVTFLERIQRLKPIEGDILYSREGGILGVACRVPPNTELCLGQRMMLIRPPSDINSAFLEMLLNSPLITEIAREKTTGGAAPRVNVSTVKAYPVPLPPLAEQHRIVARVDELMTLCDQLEAQLIATEADSRRLLEAVLHEALAPAMEPTA